MSRLWRVFPLPPFAIFVLTLLALSPRLWAFGFPGSNDNLFPPAPAAKAFVDFDGRGFLIHGRRTFIVAGDMHYSRIPRALWRDRLLRVKRAGYNTVQTYSFWNFHETHEGKFDFSGDKDLNAYLQLIHSLGMYAIVRIGPYVNAEWDSGGWPVWLRFKPGLVVRDNNRPYLFYLDRWLDHLMPIVSANQINRGGSVIMVQMENEDTRGAGTDLPNPYFQHLKDKCVSLGLQVPCFFSGLNHGDNPASDAPFDITQRTSPWYSTEFWTGWIAFYGSDPDRTAARIHSTWNVIANGGAGYTHYTIAGGTDFETWGCDQQAAAYDFGAPIGQAGDLRPMYYGFKRAALFATSFPEILADAPDATPKYQGVATGPGVSVVARQGPAGAVVFLRNDADAPVKTQVKDPSGASLPNAGPITLTPREIIPVVENTALAPGVKLEIAAARTLGVIRQGSVTTLVIYGAPGDPAEVHFQAPKRESVKMKLTKAGGPMLVNAQGQISYWTKFPNGAPELSQFAVGDQTIRVLAVSSDMADRTYFLDAPGGQKDIVCGPDYVGEVTEAQGHLVLDAEQAASDVAKPLDAYVVPADGPVQPLTLTDRTKASPPTDPVPALSDWRTASGVAPAQPNYADADWRKSDQPLAMGADGDPGAYAWYRTSVHADKDGPARVIFTDAGDWITAFVNGVRVDSSDVRQRFRDPTPRALTLPLKTGDNVVAILAAHYGREKLHAYIGPLDEIDAKGIHGEVTLGGSGGNSVSLTKWRWKRDDRGDAAAAEMAAPGLATDGPGWADAAIGDDVFHGAAGAAWFRATVPQTSGPHPSLHFGAVDDTATVYLNGQKLAHHEGWNDPFDVPLDAAWNPNGPNALAVMVGNTNLGGGITQEVVLQTAPTPGTPLTGWKMRGGITLPPDADAVWKPLPAGSAPAVPSFYAAQFAATPPGGVGPHPIWRVTCDGLSRGFMWLNGHSLGRYPERSPVNGLYLPECWLRPGRNTVSIFDEEGQSPAQVKIVEETEASRVGAELTTAHPARKSR